MNYFFGIALVIAAIIYFQPPNPVRGTVEGKVYHPAWTATGEMSTEEEYLVYVNGWIYQTDYLSWYMAHTGDSVLVDGWTVTVIQHSNYIPSK